MERLHEEMTARVASHQQWVCPDCGSDLIPVSARSRDPNHGEHTRARACQKCTYYAVGPGDWDVADVNSKDNAPSVKEVTPGLPVEQEKEQFNG